jgi:hypothetical protein
LRRGSRRVEPFRAREGERVEDVDHLFINTNELRSEAPRSLRDCVMRAHAVDDSRQVRLKLQQTRADFWPRLPRCVSDSER